MNLINQAINQSSKQIKKQINQTNNQINQPINQSMYSTKGTDMRFSSRHIVSIIFRFLYFLYFFIQLTHHMRAELKQNKKELIFK